jgi:hypothetical protein
MASDSFLGFFSSSTNSPITIMGSKHGVLVPNQPVSTSLFSSHDMATVVHHHVLGESAIGSTSSIFATPQHSNLPAVSGSSVWQRLLSRSHQQSLLQQSVLS